MSKSPLRLKLSDEFKAGADHRAQEHLGGRQLTLDEVIKEASRGKSGRKPDFPGQETERLNVFLPVELVRKIKAQALGSGKTVSHFVAEWAKTI